LPELRGLKVTVIVVWLLPAIKVGSLEKVKAPQTATPSTTLAAVNGPVSVMLEQSIDVMLRGELPKLSRMADWSIPPAC